jgi:hypothetical protein
MSRAIAELLEVLELEKLEENLFRGRSPQDSWQRVFGGQVIGQALVAACRTVEDRQPHSMHAYFLLGGDPKVPIIYEVDRIRDGRSFTTRRVVAIQHGRPIFALTASFHLEEEGFEHGARMPDVPAPEDLPDEAEIRAGAIPSMSPQVRAYFERERPIELRPVDHDRTAQADPHEGQFRVWIRTTGPLPTTPRSTAASWPMRRTSPCSIRRSSRMGRASSRRTSRRRASTTRSGSPPVPGGRLAPLRPGQPERVRRSRPVARPCLRPLGTARRVRGAGGPYPPAQGVCLRCSTKRHLPERAPVGSV